MISMLQCFLCMEVCGGGGDGDAVMEVEVDNEEKEEIN